MKVTLWNSRNVITSIKEEILKVKAQLLGVEELILKLKVFFNKKFNLEQQQEIQRLQIQRTSLAIKLLNLVMMPGRLQNRECNLNDEEKCTNNKLVKIVQQLQKVID